MEGKSEEQRKDRYHLIDKFGLEPVHLLEYCRGEYTLRDCLRACFEFGDVVLGFRRLSLPLWQLSRHEVGVAVVDVRAARWVFTKEREYSNELRELFPSTPIIVLNRK